METSTELSIKMDTDSPVTDTTGPLLSTGAIVGIVIGLLTGVAVIILVIILLVKFRRRVCRRCDQWEEFDSSLTEKSSQKSTPPRVHVIQVRVILSLFMCNYVN